MAYAHSGDIDPRSILAVLGNFPDAVCTPLTGGLDARMWRVETGSAPYALRLLGTDQQPQSARELAIGRWARVHELPVPGVLASGSWHDRPACLMEWAEGQTLAVALLSPPTDLETATRFGRDFGVTQARIHSLAPPGDPSIVDRDWRRWEQLDDDLAARLDTCPAAAFSLLHLDYHPFNIMIVNGEIGAVLDWANAHIGDPRVDLARTLAILQLAPVAGPTTTTILQAFEAGWREGYADTAGEVDIPPLFQRWAGAAMERNLSPKVNSQSAPWLNDAHIARIRKWTDIARIETLHNGRRSP